MDTSRNRGRKRVLKVYTVVEKTGNQKPIWLEVGVASENRDGSLSVKLDALPANGSLQLRDYEPRRNDDFRRDVRPSDQQPPLGR